MGHGQEEPKRERESLKMAELGLSMMNQGNTLTFRHPRYREMISDIVDWTVREDYTSSDHQYISFSLAMNHQTHTFEELYGKQANRMKINILGMNSVG